MLGAMAMWDVEIVYREPTYELHRGLPPTEYRKRYEIDADTREEAIADATVVFQKARSHEGAGWAREIVRVACEPSARTR